MKLTANDLVNVTIEDLTELAIETVAAFGKGDEDTTMCFNVNAELIFDKVDTGEVEFADYRATAVAHPEIAAILN